jgi:hypothetical protein
MKSPSKGPDLLKLAGYLPRIEKTSASTHIAIAIAAVHLAKVR